MRPGVPISRRSRSGASGSAPRLRDEKRITPGRLGFQLIARMKPGTDARTLTTQLAVVVKRLPERFGGPASLRPAHRAASSRRALARTAARRRRRAATLDRSWLPSGSSFSIACANVANLFIVRSESRRRDLAVRSALGAGRAWADPLADGEALLLAALGGAGRRARSRGSPCPLLVSAAPEGVPNLDLVALNPTALLFTGWPLDPGRVRLRPDPRHPLLQTERARRLASGRPRRVAAGPPRPSCPRGAPDRFSAGAARVRRPPRAKLRGQLSRVELGYKTENIFTFQVAPQRKELNDGPSFAQFHQGLMERLRRHARRGVRRRRARVAARRRLGDGALCDRSAPMPAGGDAPLDPVHPHWR